MLWEVLAATLALALVDQSHCQVNTTSPSATVAPLMVTVVGSGGTLRVGENHTLTCQVTGGGTTPPAYRWFKDGALLSDRTSDTLSFSPVREVSSAIYTCEGTRGSLSIASPSGVNITAVLPELSAVITPIGESYEGDVYSLTCASSGDESLASYSRQFRWDKGGTTGIHREATLVFDPLLYSDRGEYTCTASFESPYLSGREAGSGTITVNPVPGPVIISGLQVTTSTATSLTITWDVTGFIDRFEITYSYTVNRCSAPQGAPRTDTISDDSVRSHTLRDLNEDSNYTITVIGVLRNVNSAEATITADTSTSAPSGSPGPISFSDINVTSITVQWTELPCSDRNGEITGYTVEYSSTTPPHTNTVTVSGSNNTRLEMDGLLPRTSYTFSVRAQGPAGTSDSATAIMATSSISPPRLPNSESVRETSITSSSATIQWILKDPYNPSQPETFIVSYGLTSGQLTMSTPGVTANPTSQTYSTQLTSLEPNTQYYYRLESSSMFETHFSDVGSFITIESRSTAILNLLAVSANDTTLNIYWDPPANPNGDILSYSVSIINLSDGSTVRQGSVISPNITQYNLVPGVPYNVSIAAVNRAGPGEFTVFIHFTRQLAPSIAPKNISISRPSATVMVVSWIPLSYSEARGFISHYTVAYSPLTGVRKRQALDTMTQTVPGMDANTTRIGGLDANADYIVQVSATNGAGRSEVSPPVFSLEITAASGEDESIPHSVLLWIVFGEAAALLVSVVTAIVLFMLVLVLMVKLRRAKQSRTLLFSQVDYANQGSESKDEMYSDIQTLSSGDEFARYRTCVVCASVGTTQAPYCRDTVREEDQNTDYEEMQSTSRV